MHIVYKGYFARYAALRKLLYEFLDYDVNVGEKGNKKQILSLGAGFDTTYFLLQVLEFSCDRLFVSCCY